MDRSWVAVLSIQLPCCEARRSSGILRWTAVFVAALVCASPFVATARAEDRAPPAPDGAPLSSDSTPNDGASASPPDSSATATETSAATDASAATPSDTSSGSDAQAPDSTSGAASASTEAGALPPTPTPADAGAPTEAGASTSAASGSADPVPAGSPATTDRNEATIAVVPTSKLARKIGAVGVFRSKVDCRMIVVCGFAPLARAPSDFERALFNKCSSHEAARPGLPGGRPGGSSGRPDGAQRPGSPRLPA